MATQPTVKWAQRKDRLFLTVDIQDIKDEKVALTAEKVVITGKVRSAGRRDPPGPYGGTEGKRVSSLSVHNCTRAREREREREGQRACAPLFPCYRLARGGCPFENRQKGQGEGGCMSLGCTSRAPSSKGAVQPALERGGWVGRGRRGAVGGAVGWGLPSRGSPQPCQGAARGCLAYTAGLR